MTARPVLWVSVVTLQKRPRAGRRRRGNPQPTSIEDARGWAILSALTAISPNIWPASPYSTAEFKALAEQFIPKAAEPAGWHPAELRIDDEAMDGGAYFLAIGGRNVRLNEFALLLGG